MNLTDYPTTPMNAQLRELLCRIPCSPETDELQDFLTVYEAGLNERLEEALHHRNEALREAAAWREVAEMYRDLSRNCLEEDADIFEQVDEAFDALKSQLTKP